ncbi:MAG: hypothetical protein JNL07_01900 [Rhodospirillales bacterium]|nr:hypothetical protein [Rhodospirillales bacterium]
MTVMAGEGPHNINDHGSVSGEGLLTTICGSIAQPGSNLVYGKGPYVLLLGPEHAATLRRDGWEIDALRDEVFKRARVHYTRVSQENRESYASTGHVPIDDHYRMSPTAEDVHIAVAGGPGKHSAYIPSFGGTAVCSVRVNLPA